MFLKLRIIALYFLQCVALINNAKVPCHFFVFQGMVQLIFVVLMKVGSADSLQDK